MLLAEHSRSWLPPRVTPGVLVILGGGAMMKRGWISMKEWLRQPGRLGQLIVVFMVLGFMVALVLVKWG
jgi:hypothetical protein